ncbi:hypothetical protein Tco_0585746 [Tanacetum coccineum]
MGKGNMKEPVPRDLPPTPFQGHLKEQMGSPYRTHETDYDIPLHDGVIQPLTPQILHITPPDDDYVAPATSPTLDKQLNKFRKECSDITRVAEKVNGNPVEDVQELSYIKAYDCETFIWKLLHQGSQSSHETGKTKREMKSHQRYGSNLSFPYLVTNLHPFQQIGGKFRDRFDLLWFCWISFDYHVTLGFGSIAGGLDHVNPVIRLPLERGISKVIRLVLGIVGINHYDLVALPL